MGRRRANRYVAVEAESGSTEESEEYDSSVVSEDLVDLHPVTRSRSYRDLAREMEERYAGVDAEVEESGEDVLEPPSQAALLPNARSPLLFLLRCKPGKERAVCQRMMESGGKGEGARGILSVVHKEGLKGYLYVEAYKKQAVEDSLAGIPNVSRRRIAVVPVQEMVEALTYRTDFTPQEFARVKGGKYKGDLVQVLDVTEGVVKIKAVPRLDTTGEYQEKRQRPPQRLFNPAEHSGRVIKRDGGFYFNRDFYQDGFLVKHVLWHNLDFDAEPSFGELEGLAVKGRLAPADTVRVRQGDLRGVLGTVREVSGNTAVVETANERYEVPVSDLERHCAVGSEVSCNGQNGIVLHVGDGRVVLGVNDLTEELICKPEDLRPPVAVRPGVVMEERKRPMRVRRDALVNKTVTINGGRFRGHHGVVKDVHRGKCRVQLSATTEFVTVDLGMVTVLQPVKPRKEVVVQSGSAIEDMESTVNVFSATPKTPGYQTPGHRTPNYRTPGFRTPGESWSTPYAVMSMEPTSKFTGALLLSGGSSVPIRDMKGNKFIMEDGREIDCSSAIFCAPEKYDHVIALSGPNFGIEGALITINGDKCTIKTTDGTLCDADMKDLSKKVSRI